MELTEYVQEFRILQKSKKIRVADFCRERMLDYYTMVEALKQDKFLSELPDEDSRSSDLEVTGSPTDEPELKNCAFVQEVSIQPSSNLNVRIQGISASDLLLVLSHLMQIKPC